MENQTTQSKKKTSIVTWFVLGFIIIIVLIGITTGGGKGTSHKTNQSQVSQQKESAPSVHSIDQEVKVGKSIWKAVGIIKEGTIFKLPEGSELGKIYYNEPANGKLVGVVLDFVNFDEISLRDFEGNELEAVLIDGENREFKPIPYDKAISIISAEEERKLDDNFNPRGMYTVITFLYIVPQDSTEFKVKVRDETKYSNEEALIDLELPFNSEFSQQTAEEQKIFSSLSYYSLGKSTVVDNIRFTVVKYKVTKECYDKYQSQYYGPIQAPEGAKFLWLYVEAMNKDEVARKLPYEGVDIYLKYKDNRIYKSVACFIENEYHASVDEKVYPGISRGGWVLYEIPENLDLSLTYIIVEVIELGEKKGEALWKLGS